MEDIYSILQAIHFPGRKVMATIIDIVGSAYKKQGSAMMFLEDGIRIGMISAGCLEEDLSYKAAEVLKKETNVAIQYDMSDETDSIWGQGAGCNGKITILLEWIDERLEGDLVKVNKLLQASIPVLCFKKIGDLGEYLFLPGEGEPFGWWQDEIPDFVYDSKNGMIQDQPIFQQLFLPKPRLYLFGAGQDARPLARIAAQTGFNVIVCDWRGELCQREYFPESERIMVGFPNELLGEINFFPTDFVVILTHNFQRDQEILLNLPLETILYIGVMGPKERTKRLFCKRKIPDSIHSPVGLPIGAAGPEEIAISIVAELIKSWRVIGRKKMESQCAYHL